MAVLIEWRHGSTDDLTADELARYYAQQAQLHYGALNAVPTSSLEWAQHVGILTSCFAVTSLLRRLREAAPAAADKAARDLVDDLNDGGVVGEWIWQWLDEWGMDPDAISAEGARRATERASKKAGA